jgi:hypothetical protein
MTWRELSRNPASGLAVGQEGPGTAAMFGVYKTTDEGSALICKNRDASDPGHEAGEPEGLGLGLSFVFILR